MKLCCLVQVKLVSLNVLLSVLGVCSLNSAICALGSDLKKPYKILVNSIHLKKKKLLSSELSVFYCNVCFCLTPKPRSAFCLLKGIFHFLKLFGVI